VLSAAAPAAAALRQTGQVFQVGEWLELLIQKGQYAGNWVPCQVLGQGQAPYTYDVHIPGAPEGKQDFKDIPSDQLRRGQSALSAAAAGGLAGRVFQVGEQLELQIQKGQYAGNWVPCQVTGQGSAPHTYNVHIPSAPQGKQDFVDIPSAQLRRGEGQGPPAALTRAATAAYSDDLV